MPACSCRTVRVPVQSPALSRAIAIVFLILFTPAVLLAQVYQKNSVNNDFINYNRLSGTKTKVGTQNLTQAKIIAWDAATVKVNDTISLQTAISELPVILPPHLTTTEINALTGVVEGTFVYDSVLHVFKYYNGTVWKTISTN